MSRSWHSNERVVLKFNPAKDHRFYLECIWDDILENVVFIMLNPSNTNYQSCDDTIEKIISFAKLNGFGGIKVINLFSKIDPASINLANGNSLVEPRNRRWSIYTLIKAKRNDEKVVLAWGEKGFYFNANTLIFYFLRKLTITPFCLGTLKFNQPLHPGRKKISSLNLQIYNYSLY